MEKKEEIEIKELKDTRLGTVEELYGLFPHWHRASVQRKLRDTLKRKDKRFVALVHGKIIAHIKVVFNKGIHSHRVELASLIVHPHHRRREIGTQLTQFALREAKKRGRKLALLSVNVKNKPAVSLYLKLGFEKYGMLKKASLSKRKFIDNYLMSKSL